MKKDKKILVLVYNPPDEIMGIRARRFFTDFPTEKKPKIIYRRSGNIIDTIRFLFFTLSEWPDILYIIDIGMPSFIAALVFKILTFGRKRVILDVGDLVYESSIVMEVHNPIVLWLIKESEDGMLGIADEYITRGSYHETYLRKRGFDKKSRVVYDGIDPRLFKITNPAKLKKRLGLQRTFIVGTMGHLFWMEGWQWCYGWYLLKAMTLLKELPIKALIVGFGDGLDKMKEEAKRLGIEDKVIFTGRVPHNEMVSYLNLINVFVLTQPQHDIIKIRTCAKLSEVMATGRFIISSDIIEPMKFIKDGDNGFILKFKGLKDASYHKRLADKIRKIYRNKGIIKRGLKSRKISIDNFSYPVLRKKHQKIVLGD